MLYTIGKIRVSGFRNSTGSVLQSWAKHFTDQNINAQKFTKNSKTNEIFMIINSNDLQSFKSVLPMVE